MERVRRRGEEERAVAVAAGGTHPLDPTRPWDWVWGEVLSDADFWRSALEEPAQLAIIRGIRAGPSAENAAPHEPGKRLLDVSSDLPPKRVKRRAEGDGVLHQVNRKNKTLCVDFNSGSCRPCGPGSVSCPVHPGQVRQCNICLSPTHGASGHFQAGKGGGKGDKGKVKHRRRRH